MFLISLPTLYFSFTPINQTVIFLTKVNGSFFKKGLCMTVITILLLNPLEWSLLIATNDLK